ncbi:MAG TPA: hypothetical protein VNQ76_18725 [Planctomicrobium sp.]|nr:hypothetical protein [Planctomicrobium sp.]
MPDLTTGTPREVWDQFFSQHRPAPQLLSGWVLKLHAEKQYPQVIACLQSALIHGQSQPWMYEVLALTMEIEGAPKEEVERVMLSLTDFGGADYETMIFSGAYLTRFGRKSTALTLYRQASGILPERAEPYVLGLKLARDLENTEGIEWGATGILMHSWDSDYLKQHRDAENALKDLARRFRQKQDETQARRVEESLANAKSRDLIIRLDWNGPADLDMQVEEPFGAICSTESPQTPTGGLFLHDGIGPDSKSSYELYVCPRGPAGPYRITIKNLGGKLVGDRATLTVTMLEGTSDQSRIVRTLTLDGEGEAALTIDLPKGRRTVLRAVSFRTETIESTSPSPRSTSGIRPARQVDRQALQVRRELEESRAQRPISPRRAGAVGFAPQIGIVGSGSAMQTQAIVSRDRRYVKIGIQPTFNDLVDVFTFTYQNTGNGTAR